MDLLIKMNRKYESIWKISESKAIFNILSGVYFGRNSLALR
jgi:hypothetical protein